MGSTSFRVTRTISFGIRLGKHVKNNAYFGIKGKSPTGNSTSFGTTEVINGKVIHIKDTFRAYADYAESADDYGRF